MEKTLNGSSLPCNKFLEGNNWQNNRWFFVIRFPLRAVIPAFRTRSHSFSVHIFFIEYELRRLNTLFWMNWWAIFLKLELWCNYKLLNYLYFAYIPLVYPIFETNFLVTFKTVHSYFPGISGALEMQKVGNCFSCMNNSSHWLRTKHTGTFTKPSVKFGQHNKTSEWMNAVSYSSHTSHEKDY